VLDAKERRLRVERPLVPGFWLRLLFPLPSAYANVSRTNVFNPLLNLISYRNFQKFLDFLKSLKTFQKR
jgi:hypothetical protein